ncbi:diadenylate cyclase [Abditibacterium utsteinense]|uniref:Diadenylate cyclase n=1 Tax=Abditibacterium utsteinense TaxID=1960156 RepID=A0A2S8STA7_9BACT|nr:diadenylate cyclase CdaA [Abditibacterium utsteinense]PQV64030.1 diadenylate cyclase [Abditibacterium utsteinense]
MPFSLPVDLPFHLRHLLRQLDVVALLDIFLVATAIYYLLVLAQGTRAMQLLKGVAILLAIMKIAQWLGLDTLQWVIGQALFASALVLVILFQPELRAALDQLGRSQLDLLGLGFSPTLNEAENRAVLEISRAVEKFSEQKTGALIVIERETGLEDIAATGTLLRARLSTELLGAIFQGGNPLHDGACIIKNEEIVAAACILPLTNDDLLPRTVGTRHRAALGLSETTDALIVVVSEETGNVSVARGGRMNSILQPRLLAEELRAVFGKNEGAARLRPFARSVGNAARSLPKTTLGTLRAALRKS